METKTKPNDTIVVTIIVKTKSGESKMFRYFNPENIFVTKGDKLLLNESSKSETPS